MNSPSSALIWELWWKNRWGFALLAALLLICVGLRFHVGRLEAKAERLRVEYQTVTRGSFSLDTVLPHSETGPVAAEGSIEIGKVGYSGPLAPGDQLTWSGDMAEGGPVITVQLNNLRLALAEPLPPWISVKTLGAKGRTILLAQSLATAERTASALGQAEFWRAAGLAWSVLCLSFSLLAVFAIFGSAEPHPVRGFTGIPPRQFTFPVSTGTLVWWPVVLGTLTVLSLCVVWLGVVLPGFSREPSHVPVPYLTALMAAGLTVFQALVWGLASFPKVRATAVTFFMLALFALALAPIHLSTVTHWAFTVAFGGIWGFALAAAWFVVRLERQGHWAGWTRSEHLARFIERFGARPPSLSGPWQAQLWIEWQRNGRAALLVWTFLVLGVIGMDLWLRSGPPKTSVENGVFAVGLLAGAGWIGVVGLNLARDGASRKLAMSSFTAVRPVSTGVLLEAKMVLGAALWLSAALILAAFFYLFAAAAGYLESGERVEPMPELLEQGVLLLAISLHVFVGILPFCLAGRMPGFPWSLLPLLLIYGMVVNGVQWFDGHAQNANFLFPLLVLLVLIKLGVAFWSFELSLRRGLSSPGFVLGYFTFWLCATGLLLGLAHAALGPGELSGSTLAVIPGAVLIVPLARIALSPMALDMNRHR